MALRTPLRREISLPGTPLGPLLVGIYASLGTPGRVASRRVHAVLPLPGPLYPDGLLGTAVLTRSPQVVGMGLREVPKRVFRHFLLQMCPSIGLYPRVLTFPLVYDRKDPSRS